MLGGQSSSARIGQTTVRHPILSHGDDPWIAWRPYSSSSLKSSTAVPKIMSSPLGPLLTVTMSLSTSIASAVIRLPIARLNALRMASALRGLPSLPAKTSSASIDAELNQSLGVTLKGLAPILKRGGDEAEKKFMECCWCLWRANGSELLEPFIEAAFNTLPKKSRAVLFERMLTIVYVAQDSAVKTSTDVRSRG